jgi:Cu-Zn family superoxide dismutase
LARFTSARERARLRRALPPPDTRIPPIQKKHLGPLSTAGHRGDVPALVVDAQGNATQPVTAPHLKTAEIRGRSIVIHAGGDKYSDTPKPLGGGGARIACGTIQ